MEILGIVGSMRKAGNTSLLIETVLGSARKTNPKIKTMVLQISELKIEPCRACYGGCSEKPYKCLIEDDNLSDVFEKMKRSEAIVIGSPLYFKVPSRLTALMERLACLSYFYERRGFTGPHPLNDKPCGLVAVCGGDDTRPLLEHLFNFALSLKMKPVTMKSYPYFGVGGKGKVEEDTGNNPVENSKILGELLVRAIEEKAEAH
jgi:multimeric flavodoxin WrbA